MFSRPEPGRVCFNCRRAGHVARQCPEPRRRKGRTDLARYLSDFIFVWKPYRPRRRSVPRKEEGPTGSQLEVIRKAKASLAKDCPRHLVAKLRLPDGSVWPVRGQSDAPTMRERLNALPLEVAGQVLAYVDYGSRLTIVRSIARSRRERRQLLKMSWHFRPPFPSREYLFAR